MKCAMKVLSYVLTAAIAVVITILLLMYTGFVPMSSGLSKLDELETLITQRFIGESDVTQMEDAAASAMVDSLGDRWSYYLSADAYQSYQDRVNNAYVGIGVTVAVREDGQGIDIEGVTAGGPAEEAGLHSGDVLIRIDGESFDAGDLNEVRDRIRGTAGTMVELTVLRGDEEMTFSVERREIQVAVAQETLLTDDIGLITISNFDKRCYSETVAAIQSALDQGATSLIFDVRNNPGGYKDELVEVLDYLLPEGVLFRSEDYSGLSTTDYSDERCLDIPMAVLVNGESYSAAEFFAAALREYDAAVIVGEQTCGKGYFQQVYELHDGSAVGLSVGKYSTPNGVSLAGVGITPDVVVEVDDETFAAIYSGELEPMEDPQILAAIAALK